MAITVQMRTEISQLYVALFGRAPDAEGLGFWVTLRDSGQSLTQIANTMYGTAPARAYYPSFLTNQEIIASFYVNVLGRTADAEGLAFWTAKLNAAGATPGSVITQMINVVVNYTGTHPDGLMSRDLFLNKVEVAQYYAEHNGNIAGATSILVGVTGDDATVLAAKAVIDGGGSIIGQEFTLTTGVDTITITDGVTTNLVHGIVNDTAPIDDSTFSVGDTITGNGKTNIELVIAKSGTSEIVTLHNINAINVISGTSSWVNLDAVLWDNVKSVNLIGGQDGLDLWVDNLEAGTGLSLANVTGTVSASYTSNIWTQIGLNGGAATGSISSVGGAVVGDASSASDLWFSQSATAGDTDMTIGNITLANEGGDYAWAWIGNSENSGGDITVGNVTISGATSWMGLTISNTDHTVSSDAVNVTVGNVSIAGASTANSLSISVDIDNTAWNGSGVGNLTVGNIDVTATGKNVDLDVSVSNTGYGTVGNLSVGNVTVTGGNGADVSVSLSNTAWASGTDSATVGTTTVGNVALTIGNDNGTVGADLSLSITASAYASGTGKATVGNVGIGTITASIGQSAYADLSVTVDAYSSGNAASLGTVAIGNATFNQALDSYLSYDIDVTATAGGGKAATIGGVAIGGTTLTAGIGASFEQSNEISADGSATSSIGAIAIGAATLNGDDGADLFYSNDIWSSGSVGAVTIGNQSVTLGVLGSADVYNYVEATTTLASVTMGNTVGDASKLSADFYAYNWISGDEVGNVGVGNVTLSAGKNADAEYYLYVSGDTSVGDVTVGNVTSTANADGAYAYASVTAYAFGTQSTVGDVTIGNVSLSANGASAYNGFYVSASGVNDVGTLTVGNVALNVGEAAKKAGALVEFWANNYVGDVKIGNVTLTASGVRATGDVTMAYDANFNVYGDAGVTIGNVTVTGSGSKAQTENNFANFATNVMGGVSSGTGTVVIGNVDYSGYGAAATIDVSGFKGAGAVIGSAKGDTITDNKGTNALTGNAGADTFTFVDANKNVTEATVDSITDFSNAAGDKIDVTLAAALDPDTNYGENTYADFASFVTGANSANKEVFVGQIGSDSYVAVDLLNDGSVDFMVKLVGVGLSGVDVSSFV